MAPKAPEGEAPPTAPERYPLARLRRARSLRRVFILFLGLFLLLGLTGFLGVRSGTVSASGAGFDLTVTYAVVTRPGLATPWSIEVRRDGGFDGPVTIATTGDYLDMFDENGLDPDPSSATATPEVVIWEFEPPDGDTLTITLDARIEPAVQWGKSAVTSVLVGGSPVVEVHYRTWVVP
jgi:hypothetical protein